MLLVIWNMACEVVEHERQQILQQTKLVLHLESAIIEHSISFTVFVCLKQEQFLPEYAIWHLLLSS